MSSAPLPRASRGGLCVRARFRLYLGGVNVNTTDATTGVSSTGKSHTPYLRATGGASPFAKSAYCFSSTGAPACVPVHVSRGSPGVFLPVPKPCRSSRLNAQCTKYFVIARDTYTVETRH